MAKGKAETPKWLFPHSGLMFCLWFKEAVLKSERTPWFRMELTPKSTPTITFNNQGEKILFQWSHGEITLTVWKDSTHHIHDWKALTFPLSLHIMGNLSATEMVEAAHSLMIETDVPVHLVFRGSDEDRAAIAQHVAEHEYLCFSNWNSHFFYTDEHTQVCTQSTKVGRKKPKS